MRNQRRPAAGASRGELAAAWAAVIVPMLIVCWLLADAITTWGGAPL